MQKPALTSAIPFVIWSTPIFSSVPDGGEGRRSIEEGNERSVKERKNERKKEREV